MSDTIIKAENVGKRFLISHQKQQKYSTLREAISENIKAAWNNKNKPVHRKELQEEFWALKDISFEVKKGERIGIIGRNGAGKSTLLKILSRITEPTTGSITIDDRIASLLEIGTGFHPELTGRENIFLNGAVLGMTRAEIRKKFDEIVAFAEVERFLDTAVKHYSSGMYVRLAFAVAAHLEPDILIVDEVLAVGDLQFQRKCLGKMEEVSKNDGRTVLFVSHNMGAIRKLCKSGILLSNGLLIANDDITTVVDLYMKEGVSPQEQTSFQNYKERRTGTGEITFKWARLVNDEGIPRNDFFIGDSLELSFAIGNHEKVTSASIGIQVKSLDDTPLLHMMNQDSGFPLTLENDEEIFKVTIDKLPLFPGEYTITLTIADPGGHTVYDNLEACIGFTILEGGPNVNRKLPKEAGLFFLTPVWEKIS
jgi:lipopolysaccharide transport system ATP-binding protein